MGKRPCSFIPHRQRLSKWKLQTFVKHRYEGSSSVVLLPRYDAGRGSPLYVVRLQPPRQRDDLCRNTHRHLYSQCLSRSKSPKERTNAPIYGYSILAGLGLKASIKSADVVVHATCIIGYSSTLTNVTCVSVQRNGFIFIFVLFPREEMF